MDQSRQFSGSQWLPAPNANQHVASLSKQHLNVLVKLDQNKANQSKVYKDDDERIQNLDRKIQDSLHKQDSGKYKTLGLKSIFKMTKEIELKNSDF